MNQNQKLDLTKLQNNLIELGFIFHGSQIYGGLANSYDYGPLGVILVNNLKQVWWDFFVQKEPHVYGLSTRILMNSQIWKTSGHLNHFQDLLIENKINQKRYRVDHLVNSVEPNLDVEKMSKIEIEKFLNHNLKNYDGSPTKWGSIRNFNLMFQTHQGVVEETKDLIYLRPELAQGIFVNYKNVLRSTRSQLPFGIAQIGTSFRNEITPKNFIFRMREFEQMELEWFTNQKEAKLWFKYFQTKIDQFMNYLNIDAKNLKWRDHQNHQLAHYAQKTSDLEYQFPFGWSEVIGLSDRGDYDLKAHSLATKIDFSYQESKSHQKYFPNVIEPSFGVDRLLLTIFCDRFLEEKISDDSSRLIFKIQPVLAPYQVAILPLVKNIHGKIGDQIYRELLAMGLRCVFDQNGSIGKRYRRQDAIGTPICMTIIDESSKNGEVTIRDRDSMKQIKILYKNIKNHV